MQETQFCGGLFHPFLSLGLARWSVSLTASWDKGLWERRRVWGWNVAG